MFSHIRRLCLVAILSVVLYPSNTMAGVQYGFHFDQSQYLVGAGGTVNVSVYLRESFDVGDATLLDTEGLFGGGVRIFFNEAPVPADPARVLAVGDIQPNPNFDFTATAFNLNGGISAGFTSNVGTSLLPVSTDVGAMFNQVFLGTFVFTAGLNPGEVTHLRATDFDISLDDFVTNDTLTVLDSLVNDGTATITVSGVQAVPEPSSFLMFAAASIALGFYRRRVSK